QEVGRERRGANRIVNQGFCIGVARRRAGRFDALEKVGEHLAFFGGHIALPHGPDRPRRAYSDACGQSKTSASVFRFDQAHSKAESSRARRAFTQACRSFRPRSQMAPARLIVAAPGLRSFEEGWRAI